MNFKKTLFLLSVASLPLCAKSAPKNTPKKTEVVQESVLDTKKLSLAFGHMISKNITEIGITFDIDSVIQGLKDAAKGLESPLSDNDFVAAITTEQKKIFEALATKNLSEAEKFLSQEVKKPHVKSLEQGKILYTILQEGKGPSVQDQGKVTIRYKGTFLNGQVFGESTKDETLDINQLVPGLKQAMIGMKEGEKRLIHIHPEKAYGTDGMLPPNSLLCFEMEITQAKIEEVAQTPQEDDVEHVGLEPESEIR